MFIVLVAAFPVIVHIITEVCLLNLPVASLRSHCMSSRLVLFIVLVAAFPVIVHIITEIRVLNVPVAFLHFLCQQVDLFIVLTDRRLTSSYFSYHYRMSSTELIFYISSLPLSAGWPVHSIRRWSTHFQLLFISLQKCVYYKTYP